MSGVYETVTAQNRVFTMYSYIVRLSVWQDSCSGRITGTSWTLCQSATSSFLCNQCTTVPLYRLQATCCAVPIASPTPSLPKKAVSAPLSEQRSKLTLAPYWLVSCRVDCEHKGFPAAGQRLFTMTIIEVPALVRGLPDESVSPVSFQQVPQAGPAPAPGPTPYLRMDQ
jgi:hypothetical protein